MKNTKPTLLKKAISEFIGTFALVFFGVGSIMVNSIYPESVPTVIIPLAFGGAIMISIFALGHISGGHFNPAVSIAFASIKQLKPIDLLVYIASQIVGGIIAVLILKLALTSDSNSYISYGALALNSDVSQLSGFIFEVITTFFLVFIIAAVATDDRAPNLLAGFAIGFTISLGLYLTANLTGGSLNPARAIASMVFAADFSSSFVHVLGPIVGGLIAIFGYKAIR